MFTSSHQNLGERSSSSDELLSKVSRLEQEKAELRSQLADMEVRWWSLSLPFLFLASLNLENFYLEMAKQNVLEY